MNSLATADPALPPLVTAFTDFFSSDERPTFILQLQPRERVRIAFVNSSLENTFIDTRHPEFVSWTRTLAQIVQKEPAQDIIWAGWKWKYTSIHPEFTVVYAAGNIGTRVAEPEYRSNEQAKLEAPICNGYDGLDHTKWVVDWTRFPCAAVSSWARLMRQLPWERTHVGPMEHWPHSLRQILVAITACPDPRSVTWGPEGLLFYNEAARQIIGGKLEETLGFPVVQRIGPDIRGATQDRLRQGLIDGKSVTSHRICYTFSPSDTEQDNYYDFTQLPICGEDGYVYGSTFEFTNVTASVLQGYRKDLTTALLKCLTSCSTLDDLWSGLIVVFRAAESYLPYALIYARTDTSNDMSTPGSADERPQLHLKETVGVARAALPTSINVAAELPDSQLHRKLSLSLESGTIEIMDAKSGTIPPEFVVLRSDLPTVTTACVLPLIGHDKRIMGAVVLGINPRQPFLDDDMDLMKFLQDTVSNSASLIVLPEDLRDNVELQASNHRLAQDLRILTAEKNESAFASLARDAPCGMIIMNLDGTPRYINQAYLDMSGFTSVEQIKDICRTRPFWKDILTDEDWHQQQIHVEGSVFERVITTGNTYKIAIETLFPYDHPDAPRQFNRWVEAFLLPEMNSAHEVSGIMGFTTDITDRKQAEELQLRSQALEQEQHKQQLQDVLAHRVAAENFIDTISHELRNPLSAILQLTDAIATTTQPLLLNAKVSNVAQSLTEAAKTIDICAQHMKTIVDDILTLSKLDSSLLSLSADRSEPQELAARAIKIHEAECQNAHIATSLVIEQSFRDVSTESVIMDSSRVLQIILNLMSNAIKFTRNSTTRKLELRLGAFESLPKSQHNDFMFAPLESAKSKREVTSATASRTAESLYIQFSVTDTGRGLAPEEITRLFQKFSQGSAKTYTQYGGSGLGLFISKKLCELHGGSIGVKSKGLGHGCTFVFYVEVGRNVISPALLATAVPPPSLALANLSLGPQDDPTKAKTMNHRLLAHELIEADTVSHLTILIVEDNLINQMVLAKQLRKLNHTVHVANHGVEALEFLENNHISQPNLTEPLPSRENIQLSAILMDMEMPIMDGLTCTRKIRELEASGAIKRHIPIIATTANAREEQLSSAFQSGVDGAITKPFRIPLLLSTIRDSMEESIIKGEPANQS